ncbi:MAG: MFS transporter [Comamonas sp.]
MSATGYTAPSTGGHESPESLSRADTHEEVSPGDIAVGVIIGRSSEYFDFFVFGIACVLVFPALLFPGMSRMDGTLASFAIFSLAFVARPFGTAISMAIQRRWGRGTKLTLALFLLGSCTVGMAFLPGYERLGMWAIVLFAALRVGQGLALGGTWDGLPSLLAISAPRNRRGWFAMLGQLGAPIGFFMAAGLFAYVYDTMTPEEFIAWGWRYPFFVAFAINVVALFARLRIVVGQSYSHLLMENELEAVKTLEVVRFEGRNVVIGAFAALASFALFHLVTIFPLSYIELYSDQPVGDVLRMQMVGAAAACVAMFVSGWLADRFGRRNTLGAMAALICVFSFVGPGLLGNGPAGNNAFLIIGFILLGLSYAQSSGTVTANFTPHYRYTGAALSADMAWLVGAAFAPLIALAVSARFGLFGLGIYLLSGGLCTLAALAINRAIEARGSPGTP